MFTATGFIVMCVAASSTCTAKAVLSPPSPCGPTPSEFTAPVSAASSFAPSGSLHVEPSGRTAARFARCTHKIGRATDTHTDDRRRTCSSAGIQHAVDHERLDCIDTVRWNRHLQKGIVLRPRAFRNHFDRHLVTCIEVEMDHRHSGSARGVLVDPRDRMHDRRAKRKLARGALAPAPYRLLQLRTVDRTPRPIVTL